ncbi:HAD-IIIC family phosphatase [Fusobacterium varium]|uniref:Capsular biosynthesis protein n=1 Tax=Fusobacterium varium ATCC 27725 TaxID=469618 RepID=A0ABN5JHB5_FUSVA|nr:HAD-IIIC family phosphatase [Fusobacterium varium]AVQ31522.1 capsular biosynthesis protein [Fusobacterium varium ATCC 27725]EES62854.1 capsule biosynthesis phosphatase [Fusobacterium varium ATCC 27725]VEH39699.1 capsule biosynthesis phosphatase [Fusobacterium varium]
MIENKNVIVMDIDGTLCKKRKENENYLVVKPKKEILNKLKEYKDKNFYIILYTSRQMKTYKGNIGKINANTAKILFQWLDKYEVPYDEIYFGKPWCGINGFYVDDKAIRPEEFEKMDYNEILKLIGEKK